MPNLANTFVNDITPAIYEYNREPGEESYKQLVSACKRCLSIYSKVINDIEEEYNRLNSAINTGQAIDSILKRLGQVTTVLNQFNEYQIGHANTLFIPIALKLEETIKSMEGYGNTHAKKLKQHKEKLESLKGIIANQEVDILIPKIQKLNNRAKLLQDNIRNSGIQTPSKKVNTTPLVKNVALPNQVGIVEENSLLERKVKPSNSRKRVVFNEQANQVKNIKPAQEEFIDHFKSKKPEEAIPELLYSLEGLKKSPHRSMNKEIKLRENLIEIKKKEKVQNKPKNIQYSKSVIYFTVAATFSAIVITAAFLTQTYIILAALTIPAIIGLYGWSLHREENKPDSNLQGNREVESISTLERKA